jgi:LPS export ABC transporter protein LptC|tara:strand:- start:129 stop:728 length:600 start_codon:yes stop_codon:yes gene_type:complete
MSNRKSKIVIIQFLLFIISGLIIFTTYFKDNKISEKEIISSIDKEKIKSDNISQDEDVFYNIEYSGLDLSGNRYILKSKEARSKKKLQEIVNMKTVNAIFYFKDNTTLYIESDKGIYNNKTLDMIFENNVKAKYEGSELFGEKIVYLNSKKSLIISKNVIVNDSRGSISADNLLFDLETKTLDITSGNRNKVNANVNLK